MIEALKRHWWVLVMRGICGIIFGVIALAYPGLALATLVVLFGAWVLIDGVFRIIGATARRASDPDWGFHLIIGILGVVVGFLTFRAPGITALVLIIYIAAWALMVGAAEIAFAIKLRKEMKGEWFLILMGWPRLSSPCCFCGIRVRALSPCSGSSDLTLSYLVFRQSFLAFGCAASVRRFHLSEIIQTRLIPPRTIQYTHSVAPCLSG